MTDDTSAAPGKVWKARTLLTLGLIAVVVALAVAALPDPQAVLDAFAALPVTVWVATLALSLLNYALRFGRWAVFLRQLTPQALTVPPLRHGVYYMAGFAYTLTPGKLGEAMRALYLKPYGVTASNCMAVVFAERLMDVLSMFLLALLILLAPKAETALLLPAGLCIAAGLLMLRSEWPQRLCQRYAVAGRARPLFLQTRQLLRTRLFYAGTALGVLGWGLEGFGLWLVCEALQPGGISVPVAISAYAAGVLAGALSFLPGGLGGAEAVMTTLLTASGLPLAIALAAALVCRLATLWFAFVLGLLASGGLAIFKRY